MEIRGIGLYRDVLGFDTFEAYCKSKWDFNRAHAYRLMDSARVIEVLSPIGDKPLNEAQTRPLVNLTADQQREAWQRAVEVVDDVSDRTQIKPVNLEQTRPLVNLPTEKRGEAWAKAVETAPEGKVTAAPVRMGDRLILGNVVSRGRCLAIFGEVSVSTVSWPSVPPLSASVSLPSGC